MKLALAVVLLALALAPHADAAAERPQTIPALHSWTPSAQPGTFAVGPSTRIVHRHPDRSALRGEARQLAADLGTLLGRRVATTARKGVRARGGDVVLGRTTQEPALGAEGYALRIGRAFTIVAPTDAGVFYGGRSLLQLVRGKQPIPTGRARDRPRYPERGMMVDAGPSSTSGTTTRPSPRRSRTPARSPRACGCSRRRPGSRRSSPRPTRRSSRSPRASATPQATTSSSGGAGPAGSLPGP